MLPCVPPGMWGRGPSSQCEAAWRFFGSRPQPAQASLTKLKKSGWYLFRPIPQCASLASTLSRDGACCPVPLCIAVAAAPQAGHCLPLRLVPISCHGERVTERLVLKTRETQQPRQKQRENGFSPKWQSRETDASTLEVGSDLLGQRDCTGRTQAVKTVS